MANAVSKRRANFQDDDAAMQDSSWLGFLTASLGVEDFIETKYSDRTYAGTQSQLSDGHETCEGLLSMMTQETAKKVGHVIDDWLGTSIESQSEVTITKSQPTYNEGDKNASGTRKCFGKIHSVPTRLEKPLDLPQLVDLECGTAATVIPLHLNPLCNVVLITLKDGTNFGQLSDCFTEVLRSARSIKSVSFEGFADTEKCLQVMRNATKLGEVILDIDINIYGSSGARDELGSCLSTHGVYLQHPAYCDAMYEYDNPHMMDFSFDLATEISSSIPANSWLAEIPEDPNDVIKRICDEETRDRGLHGLDGGALVRTQLFRWQKEAVEFMIQREVGPIPVEFKLWKRIENPYHVEYRHLLTGECTRQEHPETGGGILADAMGMGKTLSALALIARTLPEAIDWSARWKCSDQRLGTEIATGATLIVLPSLLIMNQWCRQIETHLVDSVLVLKYHGKRREKLAAKIQASGIVLTTYHTLAADRKLHRMRLRRTAWFRILLDEAHTIRQQQTTLFAAVSELVSTRRWCLTGTPIQNGLDDLGSLLAFIRAQPLSTIPSFRKYIVMPFRDTPQETAEKLSLLLGSICLRRTSKRLELPPLDLVEHVVEFSAPERRQYDETFKLMAFANSHRSREKRQKSIKNSNGKFQIMLQLRLICNHGSFQRPFSWDEMDILSQREDIVQAMGATGEMPRARCHEDIQLLATNCTARKYLQMQSPVLCCDCEALETDQPGMPTPSTMTDALSPESANESAGHRAQANFVSSGFSSKMKLLMEIIVKDLDNSKSIIFSSWTKTLDLVERHLKREGLPFLRIDGNTGQSQRQGNLDRFSSDSEVRILLMTTGTGAYGLNLTVANRIFLVEPHWNPSVELQAIARAQRYPQTKTVQVHRLIVAGTVEKDIRNRQNTKTDIASIGFKPVETEMNLSQPNCLR